MNPEWVVLGLTIVGQLVGLALLIGSIKSRGETLTGAVGKLESEHREGMTKMVEAIATLSKNSAVNEAQHADIARRLDDAIRRIGEHDEKISVLRTQSHMHANKLMELDKNWKPYRSSRSDDE